MDDFYLSVTFTTVQVSGTAHLFTVTSQGNFDIHELDRMREIIQVTVDLAVQRSLVSGRFLNRRTNRIVVLFEFKVNANVITQYSTAQLPHRYHLFTLSMVINKGHKISHLSFWAWTCPNGGFRRYSGTRYRKLLSVLECKVILKERNVFELEVFCRNWTF